jgi:hypothetical protein
VRVVSLASDLDRRSTIGPGFTRAMTGVMGMVGAHFPGSAETARHYLVGVSSGRGTDRLPRRKDGHLEPARRPIGLGEGAAPRRSRSDV